MSQGWRRLHVAHSLTSRIARNGGLVDLTEITSGLGTRRALNGSNRAQRIVRGASE